MTSFKRQDLPVRVRSIRPAKGEGLFQVEFEQKCLRTDTSARLSVFMMGDRRFGPPYNTRVAFQVMTSEAIKQLGLKVGEDFPEEWGARISIHEFCEGDSIPDSIQSFYKGDAVFRPREWEQGGKSFRQTPKMTPPVANIEQRILVRDDEPIYRNTHVTLLGSDQSDYLVKHTNEVEGSAKALAQQKEFTPDL